MHVLITGGTGFIGAYTARMLAAEGHRVVCYDLLPDGNSLDRVLPEALRSHVKIVQGDVTDAVALLRAISEHEIDTVVHLASLLTPASAANPLLALRVNCESLIHVLEAARILKLRRVVWSSSVAVFGEAAAYTELPLPDTAPHKPNTVYGATKSLNEFLAQHYFESFGVDSIGLRYTIVYGNARMRGASAFASELLMKPALGEAGVVAFADAVLDWQFVEDAALATVLAVKHPTATKTRVFNTGGVLATGREVASIVQEILPESQLTLEPGQLLGIELPAYDLRGIEAELGYVPQFDLRRGVIQTIQDVRHTAGLPVLEIV